MWATRLPERRAPSLRWRLFLLLSSSTLLVWLGVSWFVHEQLLHEVDEIYDGQLQQSGRILAGLIRAGAGKITLSDLRVALPTAAFDGTPQLHSLVDEDIHQAGKYERVIGFQIVDRNGALIFRSPGAPETAFPTGRHSGISETDVDGVQWRVCSFHDGGLKQTVHIGEQYAVRLEVSRHLLRSMAIPVLIGILVIGVMIWLSLEKGLRPLSQLAYQVGNREPNDLSAVELSSESRETRPIVDSLNGLLARLRRTFDAERQFTGDAAHELRTPLAALKIQSQVALRATDEQVRTRALSGVLKGIDRATHLVSQLLDLSRLDCQQKPEPAGIVDVSERTRAVVSELTALAGERRITVAGDGDPDAIIDADETLASMLICNLLDNALRYSDTGGHVRWSVKRQTHHVILDISDSGPGIPAKDQQSVFERFHRLPSSHGASGAGLGLSIVGKIAGLYNAEISLADSTAGRGLRVSVRFPSAAFRAADITIYEDPKCLGDETKARIP